QKSQRLRLPKAPHLNMIMKNNAPRAAHELPGSRSVAALLFALSFLTGCGSARSEYGFVDLFNGQTLKGWTLVNQHGPGYGVTNGVIFCARDGGGNLFTEKEFSDFILRLEYKLEPGGNNGVGIRAPLSGDAAYVGMEIQILDDNAPKHATIKPWQFNGSV